MTWMKQFFLWILVSRWLVGWLTQRRRSTSHYSWTRRRTRTWSGGPGRQEVQEESHFTLLRKCPTRNSVLLADGLGFRYGLRKHSSWTTWNWACTSRLHDEKNVPYKATVSQRVSFSIPTDEILSSNNYPRIFKTFLVMDLYSFQYQDASVGERDSKLHSRLVIDAKTAAKTAASTRRGQSS